MSDKKTAQRRYWWRGALTGVGAIALVIAGVGAAKEDATPNQPATRQTVSRAGDRAASRPWHPRRGPAATAMRDDAPSDEQWSAAVEFMGEYSPNRLKVIEEYRAKSGQRYANLRKLVWDRYRDLTSTRDKGDQELYDLKISLVQADDQAWALQRHLHEVPDEERQNVKRQLRQKTAEVVRLGLKERSLRIARLEKALDEEKMKLANDQENIEQRITERMQAMTGAGRGASPHASHPPSDITSATTSQVK
jgi:hypothetical protein